MKTSFFSIIFSLFALTACGDNNTPPSQSITNPVQSGNSTTINQTSTSAINNPNQPQQDLTSSTKISDPPYTDYSQDIVPSSIYNIEGNISSKAYVDPEGKRILAFHKGGTGHEYTLSANSGANNRDKYKTRTFTWMAISQNSEPAVELAFGEMLETLETTLTSLSLTDKNQIVYSAHNTVAPDLLAGMRMGAPILKNECATLHTRILEFYINKINIIEQCGTTTEELPLILESVNGVNNLMHAYGNINGEQISVYIMSLQPELGYTYKLQIFGL